MDSEEHAAPAGPNPVSFESRSAWSGGSWIVVVWTFLCGLVIGYEPLFQCCGAPALTSDEYLRSAVRYGAAAVALLISMVGVVGLRGPRSAAFAALVIAWILALLSLGSWRNATQAFKTSPYDDDGQPVNARDLS